MTINWRLIITVILVLILIGHRHQIIELIHRFRIGDMLGETADYIWSWPMFARYMLLVSIAGFLSFVAILLTLEKIRSKKNEKNENTDNESY